MKKTVLTAVLLLGLGLTAFAADAPRNETLLDSGWTFFASYDINRRSTVETVTVPHSWNLTDVFEGLNYNRGTYLYQRNLVCDASMKDKRVFLKCDGVNTYAEIAVNRQYVGQHASGYTACCFEITDWLKEGDNKLTIVASNAYRTDIAPMAGDFNMYGGITRPVHLIVTGKDCISPLDYASTGVYVHQDNISAARADISVETVLSLKGGLDGKQVRVSIVDAAGKTVASGQSAEFVRREDSPFDAHAYTSMIPLSVSSPRLWNGRQDPYQYKVAVELLSDGQVVDRIEEQTGFRYFHVDVDEGFFLNGKHLDLHGVCRHEEGYQTGGLYNEEAMAQDADIIYELGSTGVRFVHYPHSKYDVQMYDQRGIVLWYELNLAGPGGYGSPGYMKNPDLEKNVMQNLIEMIRQNYNSPAICFWSLCNELSFKYDEPATFLRQLNAKAKEIDPQRLTTFAICYDQDKFQGITDVLGWNKYFGWYLGEGGVGEFMDQAKIAAAGQPLGLCEYGAAGSPNQHGFERRVSNRVHLEEYQARVHEDNWRAMSTRPFVWCKFIWQYSDNPSSIRDEGDMRGMNDKGIVTWDRSIRKDAYYFYKANWNPEPMLYIAARRYTQRGEGVTDVKVYTNQAKATLYLNGKKLQTARKDDINCIVFHDVTLKEGENTIMVKAGKLSDECSLVYDPSLRPRFNGGFGRLDGAVN